MKPAWHEVVASLETSLARGSNGLTTPAPRPVAMRWHEPVADRPAPRPRAAAATRADFLAILQQQMAGPVDGLAVVLLDIDGFKAINHEHGYAAGDRVLETTAARLEGAAGTSGSVARFGSDEFAVILTGIDAVRPLVSAEKLLAAIAEPLVLGGDPFRVDASAGVACRAETHGRPEDLLRDADRALSRARTLGGGRAVVHDATVSGRPLALSELEVALRRALDTDEFREHFQPIVSVKGGQVAGFEVHLWRRSTGGRRR